MANIKTGTNEFYMEENGKVYAKIEFIPSGIAPDGKEQITITHTNVDPAYSGKGLARQLVQRVVEYARKENKYIIPECSYAKRVLENTNEYHDVLAK
jgi:uncharacterized protein